MAWPSPTCSRIAETRRLDELGRGPVGLGVADAEEEVAQQLGSPGGVPDLGMKLHRPDVARGIGDTGHGIGGTRGQSKSGGQLQGLISMRHPDVEGLRQAGKQGDLGARHDRHLGRAVLALFRGAHLSTQVVGKKLQAIADAENRQSQSQHLRVRGRSIRVVDRAGASGEDQPDGMMRSDLGDGRGAGEDYREDILFSYAARDELGVLAAKIQDDDRGGIHVLVFQSLRISVNRMVKPPELDERG